MATTKTPDPAHSFDPAPHGLGKLHGKIAKKQEAPAYVDNKSGKVPEKDAPPPVKRK